MVVVMIGLFSSCIMPNLNPLVGVVNTTPTAPNLAYCCALIVCIKGLLSVTCSVIPIVYFGKFLSPMRQLGLIKLYLQCSFDM